MPTRGSRQITQGLVAGGIGFVTVAVVFMIVNVAAGRSPFYTAALLGGALFGDLTDPAQVSITARAVLAYSVVHLLVFVGFGVLGAALATLADRGAQLWYVAVFFFIFVSFHLIAAVQSLADPMRAALSPAMIWGAGLAAGVLMSAYLIRVHPLLRARQPW